MLLILFLMIMLLYSCLKKQIMRKTAFNRTVMRQVPTIPPAYSEPPAYNETETTL